MEAKVLPSETIALLRLMTRRKLLEKSPRLQPA
jgi:hypothetical protein